MGIILGILGVIIAIWILGALFQLILGIAGTILGMGLLIGSVALTFMFPYIMIPLLLFSYLANIYQEQGSWDGMWDGLRQKYETHPRVKELFWIGGALFLLVAPTITLPALGIFIFFLLVPNFWGLFRNVVPIKNRPDSPKNHKVLRNDHCYLVNYYFFCINFI